MLEASPSDWPPSPWQTHVADEREVAEAPCGARAVAAKGPQLILRCRVPWAAAPGARAAALLAA